jgi:ribosome recycling factor
MAYDFKPFESTLKGAEEWLSREYKALRTGRANPAVLDNVQVQAYGSLQPLKHVATIAVEDARTIRVQPFDASVLKDIERAIVAADLGLGTVPDQSSIRISFPDLTTERRQEMVKTAKTILEDARTRVRVARDECWKEIQEKEKEGGMSEDDKFRGKDDMQKRVDDCNTNLENLFKKKETEMMS